MRAAVIGLLSLTLLGGCSQKEMSDGAKGIGNDIKRVIRGEN